MECKAFGLFNGILEYAAAQKPACKNPQTMKYSPEGNRRKDTAVSQPCYWEEMNYPSHPMKQYTPLTDVDSVILILSHISFLGGVSEVQRSKIFRILEIGHFKAGEYVSRRGDEPSHIYIIKSGKIDLLITDKDVAVRKREFTVGDCFGEAALLSMVNNTASFVAAEDSELIALPRRALNQLRREDPDLFCHLILNLARELARKLQFTDDILLRHEHEHAM